MQLTVFPSALWKIAGKIAVGFGAIPEAQVVSVTIIAHFLVSGFLSGYILTRLFLQGAMLKADDIALQAEEEESLNAIGQLSLEEVQLQDRTIVPSAMAEEAKTVRNIPFEAMTTVPRLVAWARAQSHVYEYDSAQRAYKKAVELEPENVAVRSEYARVLIRNNQIERAKIQLTIASKSEAARSAPEIGRRITLQSMDMRLYDEYPGGFEQAIEIGSKLIVQPGMYENPDFWLTYAAAHGQAYAWHRGRGQTKVDLIDLRDTAFNAAKRAIDLRPRLRIYMQMLWDPNHPDKVTGEDDFEAFYADNDQDFKLLLE